MTKQDKVVSQTLANSVPISKDAAAYGKVLSELWEKFGKPTDCSTESGWKMMDNIVLVWQTGWPWELQDFIETNKDQLYAERTPHEAGDMGYFPLSYPERLFQLIKVLLPSQKLNDKKFMHKFVNRYPIFKTSNYF